MIKTLLSVLFLLVVSIPAYAYEASIEANWAWNGKDPTTQGFKFYLNDVMIHDVVGPEKRTDSWIANIENGKNTFSMTAYGPDWESAKSPDYVFEYLYIEQENRPAPTFYIRIN